MRVLALTNQYPSEAQPGEAPCIRDQVDALRAEGVEVDVRVIDRNRSPWSYLQAAGSMFRLNFGAKRYDVIHAFYGYCGVAARFQRRSPILLTYRGSDLLWGVDGRIGRWIAPRVDAIITMTEEMKQVSGRADCAVIPFGVRVDLYPRDDRSAVRRELGFKPEEKIVLFPYHPTRTVKRLDLIQAAVDRASREVENIRIVSISAATPTEVARHMVAADVMVMASDYEGSPLAVREAMAANLPLVSFDVGDVRDLIQGLDNCLIADRTEDALAAGVVTVLKNGGRSNGLDRIADRDSKWSARQVVAIYKRLVAQA